jgi:ribosomal protein S25
MKRRLTDDYRKAMESSIFTAEEMAAKMGIDYSSSATILCRYVKKGIVKKVGRNGRYVLYQF